MKYKTYFAVLLLILSWLINDSLISVTMALISACLFFSSAIKDFKKARRLHHEFKEDKS